MASTSLSKTGLTPNQKTFTISTWVKRTQLNSINFIQAFSNGTDRCRIFFDNNYLVCNQNVSATNNYYLLTSAVHRDVNGWYHVVVAIDTTQATASDRIKLYVNGTQVTSFATETYPSQNLNIVNNYPHYIGQNGSNGEYFDGLMAHYHYIDGTAYAASDFGETDSTSGVWKPKTSPSVTYGTNGYFLKFANSASLGTDSSGNGNNFTLSGSGTQTLDTPSNVYCTMNPLYKGANVTLSNGNLTCVGSGASSSVGSTLAVNTGKWYWEAKCNTASPNNYFNVSILKTDVRIDNLAFPGDVSTGYTYAIDGYIYNNGSQMLNTGTTISVGDIVGFLLDLDNGTLKLKKNGSDVYSGNAVVSSLNTGDYWCVAQGANPSNVDFNFGNGYFGTTVISSPNNDGAGEGKFAYTVPTGYYALNTKNLKTYG